MSSGPEIPQELPNEVDEAVDQSPERQHGKQEDGLDTAFTDEGAEIHPETPTSLVSDPYVANPFGRRETDKQPLDAAESGRRHKPRWVREQELAQRGLAFHFNRRAQDKPHTSGDTTEPPTEDPFTHPENE